MKKILLPLSLALALTANADSIWRNWFCKAGVSAAENSPRTSSARNRANSLSFPILVHSMCHRNGAAVFSLTPGKNFGCDSGGSVN